MSFPVEYVETSRVVFNYGALRHGLDLTIEFLDNIRQNGILEPIRCTVGDSGEYVVQLGNRRLGAALVLRMPTVPIIVFADIHSARMVIDD